MTFRPLLGAFVFFVLYICLMTATPDGISMSELMALADKAKSEEETTNTEDKIFTAKEISELVVPAVMAVREEIGDVSAYKHLAMYSLVKLFEFHNEVALETMANEDEENELALCWARDAGWLQVCLNTLRNIGCGPNDFFTNEEEDEDCDTNN